MTMEMGSIIGTEDIGITTTTTMKETKEHRPKSRLAFLNA
jgi:hypothetical protein